MVIKELRAGLFTAAIAYADDVVANDANHAKRKLQAVALRFAGNKLVATGEKGTQDAQVLLEQLAQEIER